MYIHVGCYMNMQKLKSCLFYFLQSRAMYAIDLMLEWSQADEGCGTCGNYNNYYN